MKKQHFQPERGSLVINKQKMEWKMQRTKTASAFGVRGSRIFDLEILRNGKVTGRYQKGWTQQIADEDEESALLLSFLVDKFGKDAPRKRKEMGSQI